VTLVSSLLLALLVAAPQWPTGARDLAKLASEYAEVEDPRAAEAYERAIAAAPGNLPFRVEFAEFLWRIRELDRGNSEIEAVIRLAPGNLRLRAHYGVNLAAQGKYRQAAEQLEAVRRGGFDNADVLYYLGSALWETGQLDLAATRLSEAAAKAPEKASIRHRLGRLLIFQGQPAAAVAELSRASELDPKSAEVLLDLGRALEASRDLPRAEAAYRRALELDPDGSLGHYLLGTLLARSGRREEAAEHIALYRGAFQKEQEQRFRAGSRQAELNLGWTKLKEKRYEEALAQFGRHPDDAEALRGASQALSALGRHAEAVRALERALTSDPENAALRYALDRERERLEKK
jgi:tetratricopeptide (TPR) repeat protein